MNPPPPIKVRRATSDDIAVISHILASSFAALFRAEFGLRQAEVTSLLADLYHQGVLSLAKVRVAEWSGEPVGVVVLSLPPDRDRAAAPRGLMSAWPVFRTRMGWKGALRAAIGSSLMRYYFGGRTPVSGEAYIDSLAVEESARRQGVGKALVEASCDAARESGCREIALHVLRSRSGARSLYESCGFREEPERRILARISDTVSAAAERLLRRPADDQRSILMVRRL
jgi:ribosomal protein S18 acetylase RimI-like enzyme